MGAALKIETFLDYFMLIDDFMVSGWLEGSKFIGNLMRLNVEQKQFK